MPWLDSQIAMHHLNINPDAKSVKQRQQQFRPEIMKAIESEVKSSQTLILSEKGNIQIGWPI